MRRLIILFLFILSQLTFSQVDSITIYYKDKKFKKAIKFGEFILADYDKKLIAKNEGYVNTISWLTWLCEEDNDTIKKEKYYKLLEDNISYFGNNFQYLIQNYYVIGNNYRIKKNYDLAEEYFKKTIKLSEQEHIEKEAYFYSLQFLGQIYSQKEKSILFSDKTKNIFDKQLILSEKLYGNKSFEYSFALTNLGLYYSRKDDFVQAEIYFSKASVIIETIYDKTDNKYLASIDNLTKQFIQINNLPKADYYNQIGLEIVIKKYGKFHKEYLSFLANKALIRQDLGQYKESQNIYDECIGLAKDLYGKESDIYGTMVSNSVYPFLSLGGSNQNAEKLLLIDYNITKKKYGENNFQFAMCLNRLSMVYYSLKLDEKAIQYNLKALKIIVNTIGKNNSNYGIVCSALGTQYAITNDFVNAEKYYLESYNVEMILYGENNLARIVNLKNVLDFYNKCERYTATKKYLFEYFRLLKHNLLEMQNNFGQNDLLNFTKKILPSNTYLSSLYFQPNKHPDLNIACYENELLLKNLSLRNQQRIKNGIEKSNDADLKEKYKQFITNKRYLNKLDELPIAQKPSEYDSIKNDTEKLEKDITRLSSDFTDAKKTLSITWKQIQEKLKPNEVVIDMVLYNYYNKKWTDSIVYGAFIIKKDSKFPKYITLFEQNQLQNLLKKEINNQNTARINEQYQSKAIADLFLKLLEQDLKGINTVYLSPSGLGHQINFLALPVSLSQTFGDTFQVHILGSTSEILNYKTASLDNKSNLELILYGNIDYKKSEASNKIVADTISTNNTEFNALTRSNTDVTEYGYLGGTKIEINKINTLAQQNNFKSTIIEDKNATEESIKALDSSTKPFVLHLATHGFFFPDPKIEIPQNLTIEESPRKIIYKMADDPMMRSGLLFAGANKFWGKPNENITTDDGILTASEISNLDLSACQLVVLSACETGLGDINGSEGVFGLQRAFKMAGVKNIIMSLWKIDDEKTVEFFDIFYANCFSGKTIHEAFQVAQTKMKAKYSPYYWAGFVLLE